MLIYNLNDVGTFIAFEQFYSHRPHYEKQPTQFIGPLYSSLLKYIWLGYFKTPTGMGKISFSPSTI